MKYQGVETIQILQNFVDEMTAEPTVFWKHCSIHHIACLFDVHRDTIYEWKEKHDGFSDTIKRWEAKRNALFLELKMKQGAWIFLAKNWLGMTDKQEVEHRGDKFHPLRVIIENNGDNPDKTP